MLISWVPESSEFEPASAPVWAALRSNGAEQVRSDELVPPHPKREADHTLGLRQSAPTAYGAAGYSAIDHQFGAGHVAGRVRGEE